MLRQASPRPSNASDFYYLGWWDVHKETICQQDGKHVPHSVPVCLFFFLLRSLKSNRASGKPSLFTGGERGLASSGRVEIGRERSVWQVHWRQPIILLPCNRATWTSVHVIFNDPARAKVPLQEALGGQRLLLAVPAVELHTTAPIGWRIAVLRHKKPPLCARWLRCIGPCRRWFSGTVLCIDFWFFFVTPSVYDCGGLWRGETWRALSHFYRPLYFTGEFGKWENTPRRQALPVAGGGERKHRGSRLPVFRSARRLSPSWWQTGCKRAPRTHLSNALWHQECFGFQDW